MLARVKQEYRAGPVMAFSGHEYVVSEWRPVPAGFEAQAKTHPLLEVQPTLEEIRTHGPTASGLKEIAAVTVETEVPRAAIEPTAQEPQPEILPAEEVPAETKLADEDSASKASRRRKRAAED